MSNYEIGDLIFTALNFIIMVGSGIIGVYNKKKKEATDENLKEAKRISEEIKKYRDSIMNNTYLVTLNKVLDELKELNVKFSDIIDKEEKASRGYEPFKDYYKLITEIRRIKQNIPSKYSKLEDELDYVKNTLEECKSRKKSLTEIGKRSDLDSSLDKVIRKLKQETERLGLK